MRVTHEWEEITPENCPRDPSRNAIGWTYHLTEFGGDHPDMFPSAIVARDSGGRGCTYVADDWSDDPRDRPQEDASPWKFRLFDYDGDFPRAIATTDGKGRHWVYRVVMVDGRPVISRGFHAEPIRPPKRKSPPTRSRITEN